MDSYEGFNQAPLSLHKYVYCGRTSPVDGIDPSGQMETVEMVGEQVAEKPLQSQTYTATAVARAFAVKRLQDAIVISTINHIIQVAIFGVVYGSYEIYDHIDTGNQFERIKTQTSSRSNPTASPHAYNNFECDQFAEDAKKYFEREGKKPEFIMFNAYPGAILGRCHLRDVFTLERQAYIGIWFPLRITCRRGGL